MKNTLILALTLITFLCQAQKSEKFNLDFEKQSNQGLLSDGWSKWGEYNVKIDSLSHSGNKTGKITSMDDGDFGSIIYQLPANYLGKKITLDASMKIKNVENGFAGLIIRIDGNAGTLAFDNMQSQNINGTREWQEYSITLDYPEEATMIFIGGILVGDGEAWFDNFTLSIDGESVQTLKEVEKIALKAQLDKEFDGGSLIQLQKLTSGNYDHLEKLGRVWGFLKYHHPEIAKGNYNWDYELFRFLPKYLESNNDKERDQLIVDWIDNLGEIKKCENCQPVDKEAFMKPDLAWITNQDKALKEKLLFVYENRAQGKQYYIEMVEGVGNPLFKNEKTYSNMSYPDDGFRLLSLFRYWNMIHYYFPYNKVMDKDWDKVLREYIPIYINAKTELEYEMAALQIIADVQDSHANLWGGAEKLYEWKGTNFPPVHLRFMENQLVVTDFYNEELFSRSGLKIGDIITKINGRTIDEIVKEKTKYYPASNAPTMLRDLAPELLRSNGTEIEIDFISNDTRVQTKILKLYPVDSLNIFKWYKNSEEKSFEMLDNNIGYVTLQTIKDEDFSQIKEQFKNTKGIIIDIRNYPTAFAPFNLGSFFVSSSTPFVKFTTGNIDHPGEFQFTENLEIPSEGETYQGKLIVLVNELSQSQAEYTAMAFRAGDNTTIIGSTTAGADGNVSMIILPGGLRTSISGIGVYYPNGDETQRVGIIPDIEVHPTIEGIRQGRDELMEKAIEVILSE